MLFPVCDNRGKASATQKNAAPERSTAILADWHNRSTWRPNGQRIVRLIEASKYDNSPSMVVRYHHAQELRTIGQELQKQNIDVFDLRYDDGDYVLVCGDPNPPFTDLIHLRYSSFELKSLELSAARARSPGFKLVEFSSMGEILRAIGRHVERLDAKLSRISLPDNAADGTMFSVEYETRAGKYRAEDMHSRDIADLAMRMYKQRSRIGGSSGEGHSAA